MSPALSKYITVFFAVVSIADLVILSAAPDYRMISKPLIMITLILYYAYRAKGLLSKMPNRLFMGALIFAWLGDVYLLSDQNFIFGLLSFLVMQVLYTVVFLKGRNYYGRREYSYGLLLAFIVVTINVYLKGHVGDMQVPVIVYTLAISTMSFVACTRDLSSPGYYSVWIGTILFLISDSILSLNMFRGPVIGAGLAVMITYILAQWFIVSGYVKYIRS